MKMKYPTIRVQAIDLPSGDRSNREEQIDVPVFADFTREFDGCQGTPLSLGDAEVGDQSRVGGKIAQTGWGIGIVE